MAEIEDGCVFTNAKIKIDSMLLLTSNCSLEFYNLLSQTLSHNRHKKQLRFNDVIYNDGLQPSLKALINRRKKPFF